MLHMILLPLLAIVGGTAGFHLRRGELSTAFNSEGLPITGAPATIILILLSVVLVAVFLLFCLRSRGKTAPLGESFLCPGNRAYLIFSMVAAALLLAAAVIGLMGEISAWSPNYPKMLLWVLCIPSGACVAVAGVRNFRAMPRPLGLPPLIPAFTCCVWLVAACQSFTANPVILDYVYQLFAILCTLLGLYFSASMSFISTKIWPYMLFSLLGLYFSIITLADQHDTPFVLLFLFSILYQLIQVTVLLRRTFPLKKKKPFGGRCS